MRRQVTSCVAVIDAFLRPFAGDALQKPPRELEQGRLALVIICAFSSGIGLSECSRSADPSICEAAIPSCSTALWICEADGDAGRGLLWSSLRKLLVRASPADSDSTFIISISLPPDATWTTLMVALKIYHLFIFRVTNSYKINWPMKVYMMRRGCFTTLFTTYLTHRRISTYSPKVSLGSVCICTWQSERQRLQSEQNEASTDINSIITHTIWKKCIKYVSTSNCFYIRTCLNNLILFIIDNGCRYINQCIVNA